MLTKCQLLLTWELLTLLPAKRECRSRAACSICCGKKGRVEWGIGLGLVDGKDKNRAGCSVVEGSAGLAVQCRDK